MIFQKKRYSFILLSIPLLLLIPLVAMQFTNEVNWSMMDFVVMAILLFTVGSMVEFTLRKITKASHRVILVGFILLTFFLVWAELAVGIFGSPFGGS